MIKNDAQLTRIRNRIEELEEDIRDLQSEAGERDYSLFLDPLVHEISKFRLEIEEFNMLRSLPFERAVDSVLQKPVLLENVGSLLAKLRIAAKLTQAEMAERLDTQQSNLSRFESETYSGQTISNISQYASELGVWLHIAPSLTEYTVHETYRFFASEDEFQPQEADFNPALLGPDIRPRVYIPSFIGTSASSSVNSSTSHNPPQESLRHHLDPTKARELEVVT